jgi:uncharacterized protein YjbI with pentapeptide repeats
MVMAAVGGVGATIGLMIGAWFGWARFKEWRRSQRAKRHRQAVEQLAHPEVAVRIAGVYALEQLTSETSSESSAVLEELSAFARGRTKPFTDIIDADIQAALRAISRVIRDCDADASRHASLHGCHMVGAQLAETWFRGVDFELVIAGSLDPLVRAASFRKSDLRGAGFRAANLVWVNFWRANMRGADCRNAILISAMLIRADLRGADLRGADLRGARLTNAKLRDARLQGADLSTATGLTRDQIARAFVDDKTRLPDGLVHVHMTVWDVLRAVVRGHSRSQRDRIEIGGRGDA